MSLLLPKMSDFNNYAQFKRMGYFVAIHFYFPIQNLPKILASKSSVVIVPVISPK
jgi:hypothetical protein